MTTTQRQTPAAARAVRLLDAAPDLGDALVGDVLELARHSLVVDCIDFEIGPWKSPSQDGLGLLVIDGFLVRKVDLGAASSSELLGPGDFWRPCDDEDGLVPARSQFTGLSHGRVARLDDRFASSVARFPQVLPPLSASSARRAQRVAVLSAIGHMKRIEERLVVFFAHMAGEWGRVSADGIVLPLSLPHALIADFVGAERPSVTTSLGRLRDRGLVRRRPDRSWILAHAIGDAASASLQRATRETLSSD
jgi:CRP-like cAMP-binding protein